MGVTSEAQFLRLAEYETSVHVVWMRCWIERQRHATQLSDFLLGWRSRQWRSRGWKLWSGTLPEVFQIICHWSPPLRRVFILLSWQLFWVYPMQCLFPSMFRTPLLYPMTINVWYSAKIHHSILSILISLRDYSVATSYWIWRLHNITGLELPYIGKRGKFVSYTV